MVAEEADDLWIAYNLIAEGDTVLASTFRKVLREDASGGREAERLKLKLQIKVEVNPTLWHMPRWSFLQKGSNLLYEFSFMPYINSCKIFLKAVEYDKEDSALRIRGKNVLENEHVKIGAFHTLEIELHRPFVLGKDVWDSLALEALRQAADPAARADLAVVLMQEGSAQIFLVGKSVTISRSRIETSIPRKHGPAIAGYDKALTKFFNNVVDAFLKHIDFNVIRCAVIASPGFTKDQFHRHLLLEAERKQLRPIIENKSRIILAHTTSGYKEKMRVQGFEPPSPPLVGIEEEQSGGLQDPDRACYGPKHVEVAHERMAIQTLLITDEVFRNSDVATRQKYANLVKAVKSSGGTTHIFSSMHVSGEQLTLMSGIAAILRFPLPDLDDIEM
nr:protein PELOTA 1 [Ipomoea trifida]